MIEFIKRLGFQICNLLKYDQFFKNNKIDKDKVIIDKLSSDNYLFDYSERINAKNKRRPLYKCDCIVYVILPIGQGSDLDSKNFFEYPMTEEDIKNNKFTSGTPSFFVNSTPLLFSLKTILEHLEFHGDNIKCRKCNNKITKGTYYRTKQTPEDVYKKYEEGRLNV